jgi:hypothetical protein
LGGGTPLPIPAEVRPPPPISTCHMPTLQPTLKEQDELINFILRVISEHAAAGKSVEDAFVHVEGLMAEHAADPEPSELKK